MTKTPLALIVSHLLVIVILAACGQSVSSLPTGNTGVSTKPTLAPGPVPTQSGAASLSAGCANAYYPIASGVSWFYSSSGSVAGGYSYIHTITTLRNTGFTASDQFSSGITRTIQWYCKDGNLTSLDTGSYAASIATSIMKMSVDSTSADGYNIPAAFEAGKTWTDSVEINGTLEMKGTKVGTSQTVSLLSCSAVGSDSVSVPAGNFDSVKVTCTTNSVINMTLEGAAGQPVTDSESYIYWYAKGVGLVKSVDTGVGGSETIVLTQYKLK
jgi:hypothetical protein